MVIFGTHYVCILLWAKTKVKFQFKLRGLTYSGKFFYFYVAPTVTDICAKFHVNVIIHYIGTLVFSKRLKVIFTIFTMYEFVEQRSDIKFYLWNEIPVAETFRILQKAFGALTMSQKNVYKWYKGFAEGRERVDDLERPGRPSTSSDEQHVNQIKELVHKTRTVLVLRDHFAKNSTHIVPQPPYSPDLAPCDFSLFPKKIDFLET